MEIRLPDDEFISNPATRTPVCLVLDVSGSMDGKPISELQDGVVQFIHEVKADVIARTCADIAVVTFSDDAEVVRPFADVEDVRIPKLKAGGWTLMGTGVNLALDLLQERKERFSRVGIDYRQPWMVLMTDGRPENEPEHITRRAAKRTRNLVKNRKLVLFPVGIGDRVDYNTLQKFSPEMPPLKLKGLRFSELFKWLSRSVVSLSKSLPGQGPKLDIEGMSDWAVEVKGWSQEFL